VREVTAIAHACSIILVLGTSGWLLPPEVGYRIQVKPGDVVAFLACQQLHELDSPNPDATQLVFTLWTDQLANMDANTIKLKADPAVKPGEGDDYDGQ
jgi:hypothetical protein